MLELTRVTTRVQKQAATIKDSAAEDPGPEGPAAQVAKSHG
jgi:hypothetical protein